MSTQLILWCSCTILNPHKVGQNNRLERAQRNAAGFECGVYMIRTRYKCHGALSTAPVAFSRRLTANLSQGSCSFIRSTQEQSSSLCAIFLERSDYRIGSFFRRNQLLYHRKLVWSILADESTYTNATMSTGVACALGTSPTNPFKPTRIYRLQTCPSS